MSNTAYTGGKILILKSQQTYTLLRLKNVCHLILLNVTITIEGMIFNAGPTSLLGMKNTGDSLYLKVQGTGQNTSSYQ